MRLNTKAASLDVRLIKRAPGVHTPDVKNLFKVHRVGQKRHRISDAFKEFIWQTIPTIEEKVEERLLRDIYHKMESDVLKEELLMAYKRRRFNIESKGFDEVPSAVPQDEPNIISRPNIDVSFQDINLTAEEFVGNWVIMDPAEFKKIFPKGCFGTFYEDDVSRTKIFSMACTKEAASLVNILNNIQKTMKSPVDLHKIALENNDHLDFEDALNQFENYHSIYRLLASSFREAMMENRSNTFVYNKLGDSFLFDTLLHIIMKHLYTNPNLRFALADSNTRRGIFREIMKQILERSVEEYTSFREPDIWLGDVKFLSLQLRDYNIEGSKVRVSEGTTEYKIDLTKHLNHLENLPAPLNTFGYQGFLGINSNIMLYGDRGTGKSGVLNYVATWAWKNNWVLLKIPSVYHLTQDPITFQRHEESRLYLQPQLVKEVLEDIMTTNAHILEKIPVDMSIYGHYNITACHDQEPEAVPNTYDEWNRSHLYDSDKFLLEGEMQMYINEQREWRTKLGHKLKNPKNLLELCKYAEKNPDYTTAVLGEIIEQLQNQESNPVLVVVDDYNWFFRRSCYPSFRYDNKQLKGKVPPYHMALCRLFMRMDGHKFKNGFKLVASSNFHLYKHVFNPEKINYPEGWSWQMKGIELDYFRNAMYQYTNTNLLTENLVNEFLVQQFYAETQGNWGLLQICLSHRYRCMDGNDFKQDKRKLKEEMSRFTI